MISPHDSAVAAGTVVAAGHPGFEVELAVGGAAEVAGGDVDHAVRHAEAGENLLLQREDLAVHPPADGEVRGGEGEQLDLRELMHAVQPPRRLPVRAGLGAVAVGDAGELQRQVAGVERRAGPHAAERDFGGGDQRQVGPLDAVNLRLLPPRGEPGARQDFRPRQVRGDVRDEPRGGRLLDGVPHEGQFQQHRLPGEEVEPGPGRLRGRGEVDQAVLFAEFDVVERLEVERRLLPDLPQRRCRRARRRRGRRGG